MVNRCRELNIVGNMSLSMKGCCVGVLFPICSDTVYNVHTVISYTVYFI